MVGKANQSSISPLLRGCNLVSRCSISKICVLFVFLLLAAQLCPVQAAAETQKLVASTVVVQNLSYYTISRDIDIQDMSNVVIEGTIDVSEGSINLYIMDSSGYKSYQQNGSPDSTILRADNIQSHTVRVAITESGTYYIVLDNSDLLVSKTVQVKLDLSFERPSQTLLTYAAAAIGAIVIVVAVVFVLRRTRRKTRPPTSMAASLASAQGFVPKHCAYCGALMHQMAKTCPACGREQQQ